MKATRPQLQVTAAGWWLIGLHVVRPVRTCMSLCVMFMTWPVMVMAQQATDLSEPAPAAEEVAPSSVAPVADDVVPAMASAEVSDSGLIMAELPTAEHMEQSGTRIGSIEIVVVDVFDPSIPKENRAIYRLANRLHIKTREGTVRPQLLFKSGDVYSFHVLEETARNLRARRYLADASIVPLRYHADSNTVDVEVRVKDVWTLSPGISYGRSGGTSSSGFQLEEHNLFGWGKSIQAERRNNVDRSVWDFTYTDPNLLRTRWEMAARYRSADDGGARRLTLNHPFFSLDTRYAGAAGFNNETRLDRRFEQGVAVDQYIIILQQRNAEFGWSTGLRGTGTPWVLRSTVGYQIDDRHYRVDPVSGTQVLPEDSRLRYPWLGLSWFQDKYVVMRNRERIERTEDVYLGRAVDVRIGYASPRFASNRSSTQLTLALQDAWMFGDSQNFFAKWSMEGRHEQGDWRNTLYTTALRYDWRQNRHYLLAVKFNHAQLKNPDEVTQLFLGSEEGMRGYPLRYRSGNERSVLTLEQRYYSRTQILRLLTVGAAAYVDMGRITGVSTLANDTQRNFVDVGIGARFGNIRSSGGEMFHLDLAYPVNAPKPDRKLQFSVVTRKTF